MFQNIHIVPNIPPTNNKSCRIPNNFWPFKKVPNPGTIKLIIKFLQDLSFAFSLILERSNFIKSLARGEILELLFVKTESLLILNNNLSEI